MQSDGSHMQQISKQSLTLGKHNKKKESWGEKMAGK